MPLKMESLIEFIATYLSFCLALIALAVGMVVYFYRRKKLTGFAARQNTSFMKFGIFVAITLCLLGCARWIQLPLITGAWFYVAGILFLAFPMTDWYLTRLALRAGAIEANPVMSFLISKVGIDNTIMVILPLMAVGAAVTLSINTAYFLVIVLVYIFIVVNNTIALRKFNRAMKADAAAGK